MEEIEIFPSLTTLTKKVQNEFQCNFCDQCSIGIIVEKNLSNSVDPMKIVLILQAGHFYTETLPVLQKNNCTSNIL